MISLPHATRSFFVFLHCSLMKYSILSLYPTVIKSHHALLYLLSLLFS